MKKLQYVSEYSLLIHSPKYSLIRIKCPFRVIVISNKTSLAYRHKYLVHRVQKHQRYKLVFEVNGEAYPYNTFKILTPKIKK